MAYVPDNADPNAAAPASAAGGATPLQPQTTSTGGSPQGAAAVPNATKAPPVQDLHAYLAANAPQAAQMGQNIAGNLNQQAQTVTGDVDAARQGFDVGVQNQNVAPNADLVKRAASDPTAFVGNPDDVTAFQHQQNAAYTGPTSFESTPDFERANASVNRAVSGVPDITTPTGVHQLARSQETNPTIGMENLDTLLLQETPSALEPIAPALQHVKSLGDYLSGQTAQENAAIKAAQANDSAAQAGVKTAFTEPGGVVPTFESGLGARVTAGQTEAQAREDAVKAALNPGATNVSDQTLADMGLTRAQYDTLVKEAPWVNSTGPSDTTPTAAPGDLANFLGLKQEVPGMNITGANVATQKDYEEAAALSKLLGIDLTSVLDQTNAGKAGTANENLSSIDQSKLAALDALYNAGQPLPPAPPTPPTPPPSENIGQKIGDQIGVIPNTLINSPIGQDVVGGGSNVINDIGHQPEKIPGDVLNTVRNTQNDVLKGVGTVGSDIEHAVFGTGGSHQQMEGSSAWQATTPQDQQALDLGKPGHTTNYDANKKGSFEQNYNALLRSFSPEQLAARYKSATPDMLQTNLDKQLAAAYATTSMGGGNGVS